MTPNEYQQAALRTEGQTAKTASFLPGMRPDPNLTAQEVQALRDTSRLINGLMGLNGEAGEAIDLLKKHLFQGHPLDRERMAKELGDIAWYLAVSSDALGYPLEQILQMNVDKLRARYPEGFDQEHSVHRKEGDL